jgi:hypothetical protein
MANGVFQLQFLENRYEIDWGDQREELEAAERIKEDKRWKHRFDRVKDEMNMDRGRLDMQRRHKDKNRQRSGPHFGDFDQRPAEESDELDRDMDNGSDLVHVMDDDVTERQPRGGRAAPSWGRGDEKDESGDEEEKVQDGDDHDDDDNEEQDIENKTPK